MAPNKCKSTSQEGDIDESATIDEEKKGTLQVLLCLQPIWGYSSKKIDKKLYLFGLVWRQILICLWLLNQLAPTMMLSRSCYQDFADQITSCTQKGMSYEKRVYNHLLAESRYLGAKKKNMGCSSLFKLPSFLRA